MQVKCLWRLMMTVKTDARRFEITCSESPGKTPMTLRHIMQRQSRQWHVFPTCAESGVF
jgi:hypothetical protein